MTQRRPREVSSPARTRVATAAIVAVILALVTAVIGQSGGGTSGVRVSALLVLEIFAVVGGVLLHVAWRLRRDPLVGWLAVSALTIGFSELPFLLVSLTDPSVMTQVGAEPSEVLAGAFGLCVAEMARRRAPLGPLTPLTIGLLSASLLALFRVTQPDWLPLPASVEDGTHPIMRIVMAVLVLLGMWVLYRLPTPWYLRGAFFSVTTLAGLSAVADDRFTATEGLVPAAASLVFALFLGQEYLSASVRVLLATLGARLDELSDLAVRAAAADQVAHRNADVLEQVRNTLAPLAEQSRAREAVGTATAMDAELSDAVNREIARVNALLRTEES